MRTQSTRLVSELPTTFWGARGAKEMEVKVTR